MNSKIFLIARILLGLMLLVFGLNKFLEFIPAFELSEPAAAHWSALVNGKIITLVGIVEITTGISLLINKYGALMAVILMSVTVNALLFHVVYALDAIPPAILLLVLNVLVLVGYKDKYTGILSA